jgi:FkbM family methyltransferase
MDYTQYGEQSFLAEYAKKINNGVLVDIGAADGVINSNSKWLIEQGWSALLVEPNEYNFNKLVNLHKDNLKVIVEHCGCSDKTLNDVKFFINKNDDMEQCATFSEEFSIKVKNIYKCEYIETTSNLIKTSDLLKKYNIKHIDFITIDAEGYDSLIINGIDFNEVVIDLFCVENINQECINILIQNGYSLIHETVGNKFYKKIL